MSSFGKFDTTAFDAFVAEFESKAQGETIVKEVELTLTKATGMALNKTKRNTPKDSGRLRGAWQASNIKTFGGSLAVDIYNNTEYAPYIEHGHRIVRGGRTVGYQKGHKMLENAINETAPKLDRMMSKNLDAALRMMMGG